MLFSITTQMQLPIEQIICSSQSLISQKIERCWIGKHDCPCCSYILLPHLNSQGIYWYCRHCHQEMPVLEDEIEKRRKETVPEFYYCQFLCDRSAINYQNSICKYLIRSRSILN